MAEPEDPQTDAATQPHDDFDDDLVGFASPRALSGAASARPVAVAAPPEPAPPAVEPKPEPVAPVAPAPIQPAVPVEDREPDPGFIEAVPAPTPPPAPEPELPAETEMVAVEEPASAVGAEPRHDDPPSVQPGSGDLSPRPEAAPVPAVAAAGDDFGQAGATRTFDRPRGRHDHGITSEGDARLSLTIYACLIGAAFSVGLTAVIALFLAWTGRLLVKGWTRSHLLYQLRTSLIGVIAGIAGVLTVPLGLGVFILSLTVIWVVVRGAAGLVKLLRREEIRDPQTWSLP